MFQVMPDTSGLTHTGSRQDYFRFRIKINLSGFITGNRCLESLEQQWVNSLIDKRHCVFIKASFDIFIKHIGRFNCQRTVYIHFKSREFRKQILFFYLSDKIQDFLRTSYRKRWDYYIASFLECFP